MEKKNLICLDAAGIKRLQSVEMGKTILSTATVDKDPNLENLGLTQLRVSDQALTQLVKLFKYSVMIQVNGFDDEILSMVSDAPRIHRELIMENAKWWVVDNRTGETVVTID